MQMDDNHDEPNMENNEGFDLENDQVPHAVGMAGILGLANLAGIIESTLNRSKKFSCNNCATVFEMNDKINAAIFVKNKKTVLPCKSTYEICGLSRDVMLSYFRSTHISRFDYMKLFNMIKSAINSEHLFIRTSFEHCVDHKSSIIDFIIEEIIRKRCTAIARIKTLEQQQSFIRSAKTHDIHFLGQ